MIKFENFSQEKIGMYISKFANNIILNSITRGVMASLPLTLGTFLIAIIVNFPIQSWLNWLSITGIDIHLNAVIGATTNMLALYFSFTIAYNYAKLKGADELVAGILSLASFIILIPQQINLKDGTILLAIEKDYLGSNGIFVSMLIAIIVGYLFTLLNKKGLIIKLPESVPEMVTRSLSPVFIAMIIFIVALFLRLIFAYTSFNNIFNFVNEIIGIPIMNLGSSIPAILIFFVIANLLWWCGIHPASLQGIYMPVAMSVIASNISAFQQGQALPYIGFMVLFFTYVGVGGNGNTLGLVINMVLFAKSERYKSLGRVTLIPNIFNINEPVIFGTPIIFNPYFFIPMVLSPVVTGLVGLLFVSLGAYNSFNPLIQMPWTTPPIIIAFVTSGLFAVLGVCCAIISSVILYFPFFKMADKQALLEEKQLNLVENKK